MAMIFRTLTANRRTRAERAFTPAIPPSEWNLLPLTPSFIETEHGKYVSAIDEALQNPSIRNIALSGNYGVGKSSILRRVVSLRKANAVELSLSTLAPIDTSAVDDSVPAQATTPTNQIQQEVVKQLLYQEERGKTPGSRFRRIERFSPSRQMALAVVGGLAVTLIFLVSGWAATISSVLQPLGEMGLWVYPGIFVLAAGSAFAVGYLLDGRLHITQLSAGPAAVTLDEKSVSYFDQYLDEIVYFFETSGRNIVIFEDIDRFNNSHIFETLRSLNTLLNASPQIKVPIRFIYAIKDSIFDRIGLELEGRTSDRHLDAVEDPAQAEAVRANRTKFFDLVIPVVPFITHQSARNLAIQILGDLNHDISEDLTDLAGRFIPDMRLLKNVRNEFIVFRDRIFSGGGEGLDLSETDLFAMMLYKSTHLSDFETIRLGRSKLDKLYRISRELIAANIIRLDRESRSVRQGLALEARASQRSARLGQRLISLFDQFIRTFGYQPQPSQYELDSVPKAAQELITPEFWRELTSASSSVQVGWRNPNFGQAFLFSRSDIAELLDDPLDAYSWEEKDNAAITALLQEQLDDLKFLRQADMADLLKRPEFLVDYEGVAQSFESVAEQLLTRGLAFHLIRAGFIDRSFTLYTSTFHGNRVSPAATNFIIHHVERDLPDAYFELSGEDVDAVVRERGKQSLSEPALFNIAILDRLLTSDMSAANIMIKSLARLNDAEVQFAQAYLTAGNQVTAFVGQFTKYSSGALEYLIARAELDEESRLRVVNTSLECLGDGVRYKVDETVAAFLREHQDELLVLKGVDLQRPAADRIVSVFRSGGVRVTSLSQMGAHLRAAFIENGLYILSRENLAAALGDEAGMSLDAIRGSSDVVYDYVLSNLEEYVAAVDGFSKTNDSEEGFLDTVMDVLKTDSDQLEEILRHVSDTSVIEKIEVVPQVAWPLLARFGRFPATFGNVTTYLATIGSVDADLSVVLMKHGAMRVGTSRPQPEREALALILIRSRDTLATEVRVKLVNSLKLTSFLPIGEIDPEQGSLFARLIQEELVADNAATFARITAANWATREQVINASPTATELITPSFVGTDLASLMNSTLINFAVKQMIVDHASEYTPLADQAGLTALARFARTNDRTVNVDVVEAMAAHSVPPEDIVYLLLPHIEDLTDSGLFGILASMGGEYAHLTAAGRDKPKIPHTPASLELLSALKERGIVSSFDPNGDLIRVNKKHK